MDPENTMPAPSEAACSLWSETIISGIPLNVTEDHLLNFLECKVHKCHVQDVQFKKQGAAFVTFENPVEMTELQNACEMNDLGGQRLKVCSVDKRGAVLIHKPHPETTTKSFKFYLGNKRRSGGSTVVDIRRDEDNMFLIAFYDSKEDAEKVAQRKHTLEDKDLRLELFDPNFGELPDTDGDQDLMSHSGPESQFSIESSCMPFSNSHATLSRETTKYEHNSTDFKGATGSRSEDVTEGLQDVTVPVKKPDICQKIVEGLCNEYRKVIGIFCGSVLEALPDIQMETLDNQVIISGEHHDVEKAEILLSSLREKQSSSEYLKSVFDFTGWDEVFEDIERCFERREYILVIQEGPFGKEEFGILLNRSDQSLSFDDFLKKYVSLKTVSMKSKSQEELVMTTAWEEFKDSDMEDKFRNRILVRYRPASTQIEVVGNVVYLDEAVKTVEMFLLNAPDEQLFELHPKEKDFIQRFWMKSGRFVSSGTGIDYAAVNLDGNCLKIKGCRAGVRHEVKKFENLRRRLKCKRAILTHPEFAGFWQQNGDLWKETVVSVSEDHQCLITELADPQISDADDDQEDWGQWIATVIHSFTLSWIPAQRVKLHVIEGKEEHLKVDAVVLCEDTTAQVPLSRQGAGYEAKPKDYSTSQEHGHLVQRTRGIQVMQPGARPCKAVIRVFIQHYFPSPAPDRSWDGSMEMLIADLFQACDHFHFTSLALPVIGLKGTDFCRPVDVATRTIAECITKLLRSNEKYESSLRHVCLCSERAACLHGLTYALQDSAWTISTPSQETFKFLSSDIAKCVVGILPSDAIEIIRGDIGRAQVEALVVPCDIDIDLDLFKSKVTKSLLRGGSDVETTLQHGDSLLKNASIENRNEQLAEQRILIGKGGTLHAWHIFYVYLPPWGPNAKWMLTSCVQKCLEEAAKKKYRTLALSSLGTGKLDYPPRFVARTTLSVVSEFLEKRNRTSVGNVKFVIYDQATYEIYKEELLGWLKQRVWSFSDMRPHHMLPTFSYPAFQSGSASQHSYTSVAGRGDRGHSENYNPQLVYPNPYHTGKCSASMMIGNIKLQVKIGDITRETCDVIVNGTNVDFDFSKGGVSRAIRDHCTPQLAAICQGRKSDMKKGMVITEAPGLKTCDAILHLNLEGFREKPEEMIRKCLEKVVEKGKKGKSVAFPALGTGASKYNGPEQLLEHMKTAIKDLKKTKKLEEVRLVVGSPDVFRRLANHLHVLPISRHTTPAAYHSPRQSNVPAPPNAEAGAYRAPSPSEPQRILVTKVPCSDWADRNAVSLFIFSDKEDNRQKAAIELANKLEILLGPAKQDTPQKECPPCS